ncbi:palmitoyltransferase ZDHHC20-B-like [Haemaphysalis longicornis]
MLCCIVKATCGFLLRIVYGIPAVAVIATFGWSYYAYVFVFCGHYVKEQALRSVFNMVYHLLFFFCLWPWVMTTFTSPAPVPQSFHFSPGERLALESCAKFPDRKKAVLEAMANKRGVLTRSSRGLVAYCNRCQCIKPDRCHHCSHCRRCITKMDHHCPWFNNCISFRTYKFFLLTLFYIAFLGTYASASTSLYFWHSDPRRGLLKYSIHISFLVLVGAGMALVMGGFLSMHLVFVALNRSTLEHIRGPKFVESGDSFNLGVRQNFMEVFGTNAALWIIPIHTSLGDGIRFPTRLHPDASTSTTPRLPTRLHPHASTSTAPPKPVTPRGKGVVPTAAASSTRRNNPPRFQKAAAKNQENLPGRETVAKGSLSARDGPMGSPVVKLASSSARAPSLTIRS